MTPYDPMCGRYASDMKALDYSWANSQEELDSVPVEQRGERRVAYILKEEGTLNPTNGHFLCDRCYIAAGMPTAPNGWVCP